MKVAVNRDFRLRTTGVHEEIDNVVEGTGSYTNKFLKHPLPKYR